MNIIKYCQDELKLSLIDSYDCVSPILIASKNGQLEAVKYLIEHNANIEDRDIRKGYTCLFSFTTKISTCS